MSSRSSYPDEPGAAGRAGTRPRGPSSPIDGGRGVDEEKETKKRKKKKKKKSSLVLVVVAVAEALAANNVVDTTEVKVTGKDNNKHGRTKTSTTPGTAFMGARECLFYLFVTTICLPIIIIFIYLLILWFVVAFNYLYYIIYRRIKIIHT